MIVFAMTAKSSVPSAFRETRDRERSCPVFASQQSPAGSGGSATGGTGRTATACTGLTLTDPADSLYTAGTWYLAGSDAQGILLAIDVNIAIRVVSVTPNGTAQVLLDETTYQKSWSFDPTDVLALRRSDGVDVLVSFMAVLSRVVKRS